MPIFFSRACRRARWEHSANAVNDDRNTNWLVMVQRRAGLALIALSSSDVSWRPPAIIDNLLFGHPSIGFMSIVSSSCSWSGEEFASSHEFLVPLLYRFHSADT